MAPKRPRDTAHSGRPLKKARKGPAKCKAPSKYVGFWASKFVEEESIDLTQFPAANLSNRVHPLFAKARFPRSGLNYNIIRPSARLASRLIQLEVLHPLIWTIMAHKDELQDLGTHDRHGQHLGYTEADTRCQRRARTPKPEVIEKALKQLAKLVRYSPSPDVGLGLTRPVANRHSVRLFPDGDASRIQYGRKLYDRMSEASTQANAQHDPAVLLALQFRFAVTLVHEAIHALVNAAEGGLDVEAFLHEASIAEMGYVAEDILFGGLVDLHFTHAAKSEDEREASDPEPNGENEEQAENDDEAADTELVLLHRYTGQKRRSKLACIFMLLQFPNRHIINVYAGGSQLMSTRLLNRVPATDLGWRVSMTWIKDLFQNAFWARLSPEQRANGVHAPRKIGQTFRAVDGSLQDVSPPSNRVPAGYRKATDGNIVKEVRKEVPLYTKKTRVTRSQGNR